MEFQSTLPRGERLCKAAVGNGTVQFQSTLPRGERPIWPMLYFITSNISIHAPARGATIFQRLPSGSLLHFNPRSREGSDFFSNLWHFIFIIISIHAPARGATVCRTHDRSSLCISIHAPARGATRLRTLTVRLHWIFQSTLPRGERLHNNVLPDVANRFQSTLPRGERRVPAIQPFHVYVLFQSTLPRGERRFTLSGIRPSTVISIHAPARGATRHPGRKDDLQTISIHAPARGAT